LKKAQDWERGKPKDCARGPGRDGGEIYSLALSGSLAGRDEEKAHKWLLHGGKGRIGNGAEEEQVLGRTVLEKVHPGGKVLEKNSQGAGAFALGKKTLRTEKYNLPTPLGGG